MRKIEKRHHKWVRPFDHPFVTIDARGTGDFLSVQATVDAAPGCNTKNVLIKINAGCNVEKVVVPVTKPYITFQGDGRPE